MVCRVARSFVRFGSFQLPVSRGSGEAPLVRLLADYIIRHHFPHLLGAPVCRGPQEITVSVAEAPLVRLLAEYTIRLC